MVTLSQSMRRVNLYTGLWCIFLTCLSPGPLCQVLPSREPHSEQFFPCSQGVVHSLLWYWNWNRGNIEDNQHHHSSGLIIQLFGWEWVFYLQGGLALLWCLLWVLLVADSPDKHRWQKLRNTLQLKSKLRFWPFEVSDMKEQLQKVVIK